MISLIRKKSVYCLKMKNIAQVGLLWIPKNGSCDHQSFIKYSMKKMRQKMINSYVWVALFLYLSFLSSMRLILKQAIFLILGRRLLQISTYNLYRSFFARREDCCIERRENNCWLHTRERKCITLHIPMRPKAWY